MQEKTSTHETVWAFAVLAVMSLPGLFVGAAVGAVIVGPGWQAVPFALAGAWAQHRLLGR